MRRKSVLLVLALALCLTSLAGAANIIWVSDNKANTSPPADTGWLTLLRAQGYTVDYKGESGSGGPNYQYWRTLSTAKLAELNAADLIIVSRDLSSGDYDDGDEPSQWNGITKPLLLLIGQFARSDR